MDPSKSLTTASSPILVGSFWVRRIQAGSGVCVYRHGSTPTHNTKLHQITSNSLKEIALTVRPSLWCPPLQQPTFREAAPPQIPQGRDECRMVRKLRRRNCAGVHTKRVRKRHWCGSWAPPQRWREPWSVSLWRKCTTGKGRPRTTHSKFACTASKRAATRAFAMLAPLAIGIFPHFRACIEDTSRTEGREACVPRLTSAPGPQHINAAGETATRSFGLPPQFA